MGCAEYVPCQAGGWTAIIIKYLACFTKEAFYVRSKRALSEKSGVNVRQIHRYESSSSDTGNMTLKNAIALANALECDVKDLL